MEVSRMNSVDPARSGSQFARTSSAIAAASDSRIAAARQALTNRAPDPVGQARLLQTAVTGAIASAVAPFAPATTAAIPPAPSTRELAAMAHAVYTPGAAPPAGWSIASAAQLAEVGLTPEMLSSPTSEFRAEVYAREIAGQTSYTVAFRGSQSASDWRSNLGQGVGIRTDHYNRALEIGRRLIVPEGSRVTITGHSLGGGLASAAALAAELDATTFNAAGLSDTTLSDARAIAARDGTVDIPDISAFYVRGEILSALQDGGDRVIGGLLGGIPGAIVTDLPEAVGTRIALDPVRPEGMRWWQDHAINRHMMDYVLSSLR